MKYKFTPVAEDSQHLVDTYKSLFAHGYDESDEVVTVKDSLSIPNNGVLIKRAIEELIIAPSMPDLIGEQLIRTTYMLNSPSSITFRTLGAVTAVDFEIAEGAEYPEVGVGMAGSSSMQLTFAKFGCKFKISEELLQQSNWNLIGYQVQQVVNAMRRFRDRKIFEVLFMRGTVVFDNLNPNASLIGRTSGRDSTGAGNGSLTNEDLIDMYATVTRKGYTPTVILCHPLHWAVFAKDPVIRESGMLKGDLGQWIKKSYNDPESKAPDNLMSDISRSSTQINPKDAHLLPTYNPLASSGLSIVTSPLVYIDDTQRVGDIIMLDPNNSAMLAIGEMLNITEWDEERNDLKVIKFKERWALSVVDNGEGIAVARGISLDANQVIVAPQTVLTDVAPILRKN